MVQGVIPKDLGGEVWGGWAKKTSKLWTGLSLEGEAEARLDMVACWDCGVACKVSGLGTFRCRKCASCSGLALRGWTRPADELPDHGAAAVSAALAGFDPGVRLHTALHLVGLILALHEMKRKIKDST